jgi:hypothetical protein
MNKPGGNMKTFVLIAVALLFSLSQVGHASAAIGTSPKGLEVPIEKAATSLQRM